ncbi:triose-phosphate isomerase [Candidatus Sulfurimonas marisnigri]|uniref:Triosephosphate isomerase n=1 Tax=Candidatus Sulfurimonas marisnigri TaxID=2740405 RepID=A0A7S7LZH4_9BACT|nr:triose-phosphate isomerase [Candidatus Sulfurimonas marisnigri]QOY54279.1 triose-phosphate isomerase [Candidatus Sulfurimonas marisnigri]
MIIAANLKTNLTRAKTAQYINEVENFLNKNAISQEVLVFPAPSSLTLHVGKVTIGAQNAYAAQNGAFTGEIGNEQLEEFNIKTILIGHSERRHVIGETQEEIVKKFNFYKELGFKIVYCIGESLQIREAGDKVMMEYLYSQFDGIDIEYENLIVAYEPIWAIGTGVVPTSEDIVSVHLKLKEKCKAPLLYGGSVKVSNANVLLGLDGVDGVLIGGAALIADDFCAMVEFAQQIENK